MSSTIDRRSFLTHSAVTVGGVAMAGTVVDGLLEGVAGAATGVAKGKPKLGGTLNVGTLSD
ncbi:MAG: twin-arginine translocation signal domain-containing protein, partial [Acidimicrobiales bacterium]